MSGKLLIRSRSRNFALPYALLPVDTRKAEADLTGMDLDELFPDKPDDPLNLLVKQDLDPLSVEELHARIAILEEEIARVRAKLNASVDFRSTAEQLFKK